MRTSEKLEIAWGVVSICLVITCVVPLAVVIAGYGAGSPATIAAGAIGFWLAMLWVPAAIMIMSLMVNAATRGEKASPEPPRGRLPRRPMDSTD